MTDTTVADGAAQQQQDAGQQQQQQDAGQQQQAVKPATVDWAAARATLPEELRDDPTLKPYSSLESLAKAHVQQAKLIGKRVSELTPEDLAKIDARYAAPADAKGYELKLAPEIKLPDGAQVDPKREAWARETFKKHGLNQRQAQGLFNEVVAMQATEMAEAAEASRREQAEAETRLRTEKGADYEPMLDRVGQFVRKFGGDDYADYLNTPGPDGKRPGNDPRLLATMDKAMQAMGEDALAGGARAGFTKTAAEAQARIAEIDADDAYRDAQHPKHAALVQERYALQKIVTEAREKARAKA